MLLVLLTMVFLLLRVAPGDPVSAAVGGKLDPAVLAQKRAALGLDRPLYVQYFEYLGQVLRGNFGTTISDNQPVVDVIRDKFGATLMLTLGAFVVALGVGLPLGRLAGRRRDSPADAGIRVFGIVTYAAPIFWVGVLLVVFVAAHFPSWPTFGVASAQTTFEVPTHTHILIVDAIYAWDWPAVFDVLQHMVLPCVTLGPAGRSASSSGWSGSTCCRPCGPTTSRRPGPAGCRSAGDAPARVPQRAGPGRSR